MALKEDAFWDSQPTLCAKGLRVGDFGGDFDNRELVLIEPLRAMRMIHYMAWLSDRWQDPAFPRAFPWFGELKYWEQQVLALKEQFSALHEPPLSLTPQY